MACANLDHDRELGSAAVGPDEVREIALAFDRVRAQGLTHPRSFRHQSVLLRIGVAGNLGRILHLVPGQLLASP